MEMTMAYKWGVVPTTYVSPGMILQVVPWKQRKSTPNLSQHPPETRSNQHDPEQNLASSEKKCTICCILDVTLLCTYNCTLPYCISNFHKYMVVCATQPPPPKKKKTTQPNHQVCKAIFYSNEIPTPSIEAWTFLRQKIHQSKWIFLSAFKLSSGAGKKQKVPSRQTRFLFRMAYFHGLC